MTTSPITFSRASRAFLRRVSRNGLTLVEILIALTMTLIVLGAMMTAFQFASQEMQNGRAALEMANRLRVTEEVLRSDLRNAMVAPRPYTDSTNPAGYWEYIEGPHRDTTLPFSSDDSDGDGWLDRYFTNADAFPNDITSADRFRPDGNGNNIADTVEPEEIGDDLDGNGINDAYDSLATGQSFMGDHDDIWAATVRSDKRPFRGRYIIPNDTLTFGFPTVVPVPSLSTPAQPNEVYPPLINSIESPLAEVIWWTDFRDQETQTTALPAVYPNGVKSTLTPDFNGESVTLYRRLLLIVPPSTPLPAFLTFEGALEYLACNDISAHVETFTVGTPATTFYQIVANSPKDLANRQLRFGHHFVTPAATAYPFPLVRTTMFVTRSADYVVPGTANSIDDINDFQLGALPVANGMPIVYNGNDIMLTDVTAFDIKVYSPNATVAVPTGSNLVVEPSDVGFLTSAVGAQRQVLGAYVDLGHPGSSGGTVAWFGGMPVAKSRLAYQYRFDRPVPRTVGDSDGGLFPFWQTGGLPTRMNGLTELVYDTWTPLYESDGVDQDGISGPDQGTNGADDGGPAAPDDSTELETSPPYPFPVRGVKITLRLIEKNTKQVHQSSVVHSYVPE